MPAPSRQNGSQTEGAAITAPSGRYPLVIPFAQVIRSGSSPNRPLANHAPQRPKPVITSSAMNSTPASRQTPRAASREPSGGGEAPPAPITGSQKNAAGRTPP